MANISSINGNPIVVNANGIENGSIGAEKLKKSVLAEFYEQIPLNENKFNGIYSHTFYNAQTGERGSYNTGYVTTEKLSCTPSSILSFNKCFGSANFVIFYDDNDEYVSFSSSQSENFTLTTPSNAYFFIVEMYTTSVVDVNEATEIVVYNAPMKTVKDRLLHADKMFDAITQWTRVFPSFSANTYNLSVRRFYETGVHAIISAADVALGLRIDSAIVNITTPAVCYFSGEPSSDTFIGYELSGSTASTITVENHVCTVPDDCQYISVQSLGGSNPVFSTMSVSIESDGSELASWSVSSGLLSVSTGYGDDVLSVVFGPRGPNGLPDFRNIYVGSTSLYSNTTDWHGPFVVAAKSNIDGDDTSNATFTGGNHNYNNTGSMSYSATARNTLLNYYVDGKLVTDGDSGKSNNIRIEWVNMVQAYNTRKVDGSGREVLEERHKMTFDGIRWTSTVELCALEDVTMSKYYGYQCTLYAWPTIQYIAGANRERSSYSENTQCGNSGCTGVVARSSTDRLEMCVNPSVDLGAGNMFSGQDRFFASGDKAYSYLIKNQELVAGDVYRAEGYWEFGPAGF